MSLIPAFFDIYLYRDFNCVGPDYTFSTVGIDAILADINYINNLLLRQVVSAGVLGKNSMINITAT